MRAVMLGLFQRLRPNVHVTSAHLRAAIGRLGADAIECCSDPVPGEQPEMESLGFKSDKIVVDAHERNAAANRECGKVSIHPDFWWGTAQSRTMPPF
jgi:hypothetical protein